jgi:hypothetical protein
MHVMKSGITPENAPDNTLQSEKKPKIKKAYERPDLKDLGLLRLVTKFSF